MKIDLYFSLGKAYVWNAEDWSKLRNDHRIVGELVGTIPPFPRHSGFCGLPMVLMNEEARLLVEKGICRLVEYKDLDKLPSEEIVKASNETEQKIESEQIKCLRDKRAEQITSKIDLIIAGKRKKMNPKSEVKDCDREKMIESEMKKIQPPSASNMLVQIPTEHPYPLDVRIVNVRELETNADTDYDLRYKVFKDLWDRGHHVTAGTKFGGDFLVYPGDPVKFHAMYVVRCVKNRSDKISLPDLVGFGRLGVAVNKLTVFAYKNREGEVQYQTLRWHETLY